MARTLRWALIASLLALDWVARAQTAAAISNALPSHPMSRAEAVFIALQRNSDILKGKADLASAHGVVIQLRSVAFPTVSASGGYTRDQSTLIENFPAPPPYGNFINIPDQNWNGIIKVQESIYSGGSTRSSLRSAKLTQEQALLNYRALVSDTLLSVRVAYEDVLVAKEQISVNEASVKLLTKEVDDEQRRFKAGTVPQFDVLRARVDLANEMPKLIQARNNYRIGKNNLLNLLGCNLPQTVWEDVPVELSDSLQAPPMEVDLTAALVQALKKRPELEALRKTAALRREDVVRAQSNYKPSAQIFGGYQWQSPTYENDIASPLYGWVAGAQVSWNVFDFGLTRGKVLQSKAQEERARLDIDDRERKIELEVRTAYSDFLEAREVLESQKTVLEEAAEAVRLAQARLGAGSGTQLDLLDEETALTQARTTQAQALRDYSVARARLQRAEGDDMEIVQK